MMYLSRIVILALYALFFSWLLTFGQKELARLLHPGLWWLLVCAVVVLLFLLYVNVTRLEQKVPPGALPMKLSSLLLLLLPILYFSHARTARFDAATFANRSLQSEEGFIAGGVVENKETVLNETGTDEKEVLLTKLYYQQVKYLNRSVELVCKSYVDERLPDNRVMCYRFLISCCAADARPIFVFLTNPEEAPIEHDRWVRVKGVVSIDESNGVKVPSIATELLEYVEEPKFPYIF